MKRHKKDFNCARDCWTKEWRFEAKLIITYVLIIVGSFALSALMIGKDRIVQETKDNTFTTLFLLGFLIVWPTILIVMRRSICHTFEKRVDEHVERRKKYGIKLMSEKYIGEFRRPK